MLTRGDADLPLPAEFASAGVTPAAIGFVALGALLAFLIGAFRRS